MTPQELKLKDLETRARICGCMVCGHKARLFREAMELTASVESQEPPSPQLTLAQVEDAYYEQRPPFRGLGPASPGERA